MKKTTFITITLFFTINFTPIAFAQTGTTSATSGASNSARTRPNGDDRVINLKTRGDQEIDRRISAMNTAISRIGALKRVSATDKATFTSQIQAEITNLQQLRTKIDADTDLATLQTDVKLIVNSYRVFALFLPKIHLLVAADMADLVADQLSSTSAILQSRITQAQSAGRDVTFAQQMLADMQTQITNAKTQITTLVNEIVSLSPNGYPGNKTTLMDGRDKLKQTIDYLKAARKDALDIRNILKTPLGGKTGTPSATTTGSSSAIVR